MQILHLTSFYLFKSVLRFLQTQNNKIVGRRFYNSAVNELNNMVEIFPSSVIAKMVNVSSCPFFIAPSEARKSVKASDYLNK